MGLSYDWARPDDLPPLEAFLAETYGPDSVQAVPGRCRWLYFAHPGGLHVALCRDGERMVACCGHLPMRLRVAERSVTAAFGIDFMVRPDYRRRGIARAMLAMRLERFVVSLSSGQSPAMTALYADFGGSAVFPFVRAFRVRRLSARVPARALLRDAANLGRALLVRRADGQRRPLSLESAVAGGTGETPNESAPEITPVDLAWRYLGGPYRDYAAYELLTKYGPRGILFARADGDGERIVALHGPAAQQAELLGLAAETTPARYVELLTTSAGTIAAARRAGFFARQQASQAVAVSRDHAVIAALTRDGLGLMAGDSDTDLLRHPRQGVGAARSLM